MLEYDRIDVFKRTDVNKTNGFRECIICHLYFLDINFTFQPKVNDDCHDIMQKAVSFNAVPIFCVKENDYRIRLFLYI